MEFKPLLEITVERIVKDQNIGPYPEDLSAVLTEKGWPVSINKEKTLKALKNILREKVDLSIETKFLDMVLGQTRKAIKLNTKQKQKLQEVVDIIETSEILPCRHSFGLTVFAHGGGFCPPHPVPELVCLSCGLNISLYGGIPPEEFGLEISEDCRDEFQNWAYECFRQNRRDHFVPWVDAAFTKKPIETYKKQQDWLKYPGKVAVKVVDNEKLIAKSGT